TEPPQPFKGLVAMGDDDLAGHALERTRQLLEMPKVAKVSVAVRSHNPCYEDLKELAAASAGRVEVVTESKELMTRLVRAHFALTCGDGWSLELCVVGIPQLILSQTKRHAASGKRMDEEGVATFLGESCEVTFDGLKDAVDLLLDDAMERKGMTRCARNLVDGRGPDRIVNGLEIILHAPARKKSAQAASVPHLKIAA